MQLMLFGPLGLQEILLILLLVVLIFGAKRLPQLGAGLGSGIRNFKKSVSGQDETEDASVQSKSE